MADLYIFYDSDGRYTGKQYSDNPPNSNELFRKLSYDEINSTHYRFTNYIYNEPELRELIEIGFGVNTEILELDGTTQIFIYVKSLHDEESRLKSQVLEGTDIEITVNGNKVYIPFGDLAYISPKTIGMYEVNLTDKRVFANKTRFSVSVIDEFVDDV